MKTFVGFRCAHPAAAFFFFAFAFTVSLASTHPLELGAGFLGAILCDLSLQKEKTKRLLLRVLLPMLALITCFNGFYNHYGVTVLFTLTSGNRFTLEALIYGLVFAVRAVSGVLWLDAAGVVLQSDKVIWLFGRLSPRLALVISMVLRFLPLMRRQAEEIRLAQQGLGSAPTGNFIQKLRLAAHRLSILISWTMERGIDTADSMRARGYGLRKRSFYNRFAFSPSDLALTLATAAALALYLATVRSMAAVYNPAVAVPAPGVPGWLAFAALVLALLIPSLTQLAASLSTRAAVKEIGE